MKRTIFLFLASVAALVVVDPGGLPMETVTDAVWTIRFQIQLLFPR